MIKWVTIYIVNLPQDSYLIKSLLESCDIDVFLKDELTIQSDNFLSPALNGVKIQVKAEDAPSAILILEEHGYIKKRSSQQKDIWTRISAKLRDIPVLKKIHPVVLVILLLFIVLSLIVFPLLMLS